MWPRCIENVRVAETILTLLPMAALITFSPIPIIATVLILGTRRARANAPAFLVGWAVGVGGMLTAMLALSTEAEKETGSAVGETVLWKALLWIAIGLFLLWSAWFLWQRRPRQRGEVELPAWLRHLDEFTPLKSAVSAATLAVANPKNLLLSAGAAVAITEAGLSTATDVPVALVFVALATLGPLLPILVYFAMPERATGLLDQLKAWLAFRKDIIVAAICLLIAVRLLADGLGMLAG